MSPAHVDGHAMAVVAHAAHARGGRSPAAYARLASGSVSDTLHAYSLHHYCKDLRSYVRYTATPGLPVPFRAQIL